MSAKSAKSKSASSGLDDSGSAGGATPLGLAVAALIICLLASLAVPRLRAVSEERGRPEASRVLSVYESPRPAFGASDTCGCCGNGGGVGGGRAGQ